MAVVGSDGSITLYTQVDTSGIKIGLSQIKTQLNSLNVNVNNTFSSATASTKKLNVASTALGLVIAKLGKEFLRWSNEAGLLATQVEASTQRLIDIYGEAAKTVGDFIDANSQALGLSRAAAINFAAVYGNLFSVWADSETNALLTNKYLEMTAVVASKTGRTMEDVQERIRSGLLGNTEAVEDLGIFVNVKTIEMTEAFQRIADGRSWEQLNNYEQNQVRSLAILEQATEKYGNQVSDTTSLTRSRFQAAYEDFKATWGQFVNQILMPILEVLTDVLNSATAAMRAIFNLSDETISEGDAIKDAADNQEDLTDAIEDTTEALDKSLASFDQIEILTANSAKNVGENNINDWVNDILKPSGTIGNQETSYDLPKINFADIFDIDVQELESNISSIWNSIGEIFSKEALNNLGSIGNNILTIFGNILNPAITIGADIGEQFIDAVAKALEDNKEDIRIQVAGITRFFDNISNSFVSLSDKIEEETNEIYESLQPLFDSLSEWISDTVGTFIEAWNEHIQPILDDFSEAFDETVEEHLKPMIENVSSLIQNIIVVVTALWNLLSPFLTFIISVFSVKIKSTIGFLFDFLITVSNGLSDAIGAIAGVLSGLIDYIIGVFTLDWKRAWNGVKSILENFVNGMIGAVEFLINAIINILNSAISGIDTAVGAVGDAFGQDWGVPKIDTIDVPRLDLNIPELASGAVIPPNQKFLAVLGDQKSGLNIETPLDTMVAAFRKALSENGSQNMNVVLEIDGERFGRIVNKQSSLESRRTGRNLVVM